MSHAPWDELLGPYLDGELPPDKTGEMREHLAICAACRERIGQLSALSRSIRALPREPMPADLKSAILGGKGSASRSRWASPWGLVPLAAAAVAVIVVATVWRASPPPVPERPAARDQRASAESDTPRPAAPGEDRQKAPVKEPVKGPARVETKDKAAPGRERLRYEARGAEVAAAPPESEAAPLAMAAPAAPPGDDRVIARYTTTLVVEGGLPARLTPLVPQRVSHELTARSSAADAGVSAITFLAQVDAEGRILSADPIGARTQSATVVESVRALLVGATLIPYEAGRAMAVVVEVTSASF